MSGVKYSIIWKRWQGERFLYKGNRLKFLIFKAIALFLYTNSPKRVMMDIYCELYRDGIKEAG